MSQKVASRLLRGGMRYASHPDLLKLMDPNVAWLTREQLRACPFYQSVSLIKLPGQLDTSAINVLRESHLSPHELTERGQILTNYLWSREVPREYQNRKDLFTKILEQNLEQADEENEQYGVALGEVQKKKLQKLVRLKVSETKLLRYNGELCPIYLATRLNPNYAVAYRVLNEIKKKCPQFRARNLFDFGSGLGTVSWAAHTLWASTLTEHMLVDTSRDMSTVADLLFRGGYTNRDLLFHGSVINHRQFLPASPEPSYDLVVSAHSLLDVGFEKERDRVVMTLWNKTDKFLVIIEQGTKAGFNALLRARDVILQQKEESSSDCMPHIFAPCPHTFECGKKESLCNFNVKYNKLNLTSPATISCNEVFSYLIVSKGPWPGFSEQSAQMPRIVSYKLNAKSGSRYHIQDLCTSTGDIERNIFAKSNTDKPLYQYLKKSRAGDILPAVALNNLDKEETNSDDEKS